VATVQFEFDDAQLLIRQLTRDVLARESSATAVRELLTDPRGYSEAVWTQLAELGLMGVPFPETCGGQGLGMIELALVLEEMGRAAYPGPFFATVVLAGSAILGGGTEEQKARYLPDLAAGKLKATVAIHEKQAVWDPNDVQLVARRDGSRYLLNGSKTLVPYAHVADLLLIAARTNPQGDPANGITLFAVPRGTPGLDPRPQTTLDLTNRISALDLRDVAVGADQVIGQVDQGWPILDRVLEHAAVGAAAEMLGAARKSLELSVEYVSSRVQFGQTVGSFQAVKHKCSEMLMAVEQAHGAVYYGAWALTADADDAALAASVAKAFVSEAARKVCGDAIQVHGGIGFTWDYDLHLYFKRAKHLEPLYGDADFHRERAVQLQMRQLAQQPVAVGVS
jgi:alkylation response protein AidB-like acyl-CoA dehydrogenase